MLVVKHKRIFNFITNSIVGTSQRGRKALSGLPQEIGCKSRIKARAETRALIGGGGGYPYIRTLLD